MEQQPTAVAFKRLDKVREVLPIYPSPTPLRLPELPCPQRKPAFDVPFTLSTHIIPAAYIRTTTPVPVPDSLRQDTSKDEKRQGIKHIHKYMENARKISLSGSEGYPQALWNCVNRYTRNNSNGSGPSTQRITLFFAHANGFTKEIWEPMLGYLLSSKSSQIIDEVWTWEAVQHGDAGLLNADFRSGSFDTTDNSRDIVNFLCNFLPEKATTEALPLHLARVSETKAAERAQRGFMGRTLVVIGHSFGATSLIHAASLFPKLFTSLVLLDPILLEPFVQEEIDRTIGLVLGAIGRREEWPSRPAALKSLFETAFFRSWDPAVLSVYVDSALYDTPQGTARLKMSGIQEATIFLDLQTPTEAFQRAIEIEQQIHLRFILPGKPGLVSFAGSDKRMWLRTGNSTNTKIRKAGHLIPQEAPRELAEDLNRYLLESFNSVNRDLHKAHIRSYL
ncbi:hypothetical protein CPB83DRAFT_850607 [Crepidotus variabilis]|uniref:AB hydrolase-1 domain-containing protein n=1 Tax=Crepidotus variabilis TaxID=179855 RepID=A0A9P6JS68_9AGAR|nr:hypothetical protein CPB83DRAFT_850607 [Crepidotus variabilis]